MNLLYYGDNLPILRDHLASASVDLIYLDPPFKLASMSLTTSRSVCYTSLRHHMGGPGQCRTTPGEAARSAEGRLACH
jgi:hypothetical protein